MAETAATAQELYIEMSTNNHIYQAAKVGLWVVTSKEDLRQELVMACYILTFLYGDDFLLAIALTNLLNWV